jgi:hypothetical protein
MHDAQVDCLAAILAEVNALGVYSPLRLFTTGATGQCILHVADRLSGVALTVDERDGPRTLRSKVMQAAPIPDTRELIWAESTRDRSMRQLAIESSVNPTSGVDAVHVSYAFLHEGSWVYLHRFITLHRFTSPHALLDMLRHLIPDLSEEEAARKTPITDVEWTTV